MEMKALALLAILAATAGASQPSQSAPAPSVVPVDVSATVSPAPVPALASNHLLYELRLANFSARPMTLESVEVLDGTSGKILSSHSGAKLAGMIATPGREKAGAEAQTIEPGSFSIAFLDTMTPRQQPEPRSLVHKLKFKSSRANPTEAQTTIVTMPLPVGGTPVSIGRPLKGDGWVAANALSNDSDHRRTIVVVNGQARIAQRYAIDFVELDSSGRAFVGDPSKNESWTGYGKEVLAVADGVVADVRDGLQENQPNSPPVLPISLETIAGNHIALKLKNGSYVLYAHLKPGSIRVRKGQAVRAGTVIAQVGNSGQSDVPHLHIHVADRPSPLGGEGLPFTFHVFTLQGFVPTLDILGDAKGWVPAKGREVDRRTGELPVTNAVVSFGH
jgi:murein DD-endopeptidase MepM/ murein hydrolase activator NlpD